MDMNLNEIITIKGLLAAQGLYRAVECCNSNCAVAHVFPEIIEAIRGDNNHYCIDIGEGYTAIKRTGYHGLYAHFVLTPKAQVLCLCWSK